MSDDTELQLHDLLQRRAEWINDGAITGDSVRTHAAGRGRRAAGVGAPMAAAAAIVTLIAGLAVAGASSSASHSGPKRVEPGSPASRSSSSSAPTRGGFGSVPQCPLTTQAPGNRNTICAIGHAPAPPTGLTIVRISGH